VRELNARTAAARETALLIIDDHLRACTHRAVDAYDGASTPTTGR